MWLHIFYQFFKMIIPVAKESVNFSSCNDIMVQGKADPKGAMGRSCGNANPRTGSWLRPYGPAIGCSCT